ncbi:MAG: hypothetical protein HYV09_10770 [Deltaproteobacteria bacterium]|nr:hypothetical protein [Deltaproteobacteria bacterium]
MNDETNYPLSVTVPTADVEKLEAMREPLRITRARMHRVVFEAGLRALAAEPTLARSILAAVPDRRVRTRR